MQRLTSQLIQRLRAVTKRPAVFGVAIFILSGCSPISSALWTSSKELVFKPQTIAALQELDPSFEHMRITVEGTTFFAPRVHAQTTTQGLLEIWLTPAREVLRTLDGRLVSTMGSAYADWTRSSTTGLASWASMTQQLQSGRAVHYVRTRDVEPGGFKGLQERIDVALITAPTKHQVVPASLANQLLWMEERSAPIDRAERLVQFAQPQQAHVPIAHNLPPAKFALRPEANGAYTVVYSEQCLSYQVCLRMQRWPRAPATAAQ